MGIGIKSKKSIQADAVFLTSHGDNDIVSVSVASQDVNGLDYEEIQAGQILCFSKPRGLYYPCVVDYLQKSITDKNEIEVSDAERFRPGWIIKVGTHFAGIASIQKKNNQLTLLGAKFSATAGDLIEVAHSYNAALVQTDVTGTGGTTKITVSTVEPFRPGQTITVAANKHVISQVDVVHKTLTFAKDITFKAGDVVVGDEPTKYKIAYASKRLKGEHNVLIPTRDYGRVRQSALIGFDPSYKKYFNQIVFDERVL